MLTEHNRLPPLAIIPDKIKDNPKKEKIITAVSYIHISSTVVLTTNILFLENKKTQRGWYVGRKGRKIPKKFSQAVNWTRDFDVTNRDFTTKLLGITMSWLTWWVPFASYTLYHATLHWVLCSWWVGWRWGFTRYWDCDYRLVNYVITCLSNPLQIDTVIRSIARTP